jgi:hypothetical protein
MTSSGLSPFKTYLYLTLPSLLGLIALQLVEWIEPLIDHHRLTNFALQVQDTYSGAALAGTLLCIALGVALYTLPHRLPKQSGAYAAALAALIMLSSVHIAGAPLLKKYYDLGTLGQEVRNAIAFGAPVAVSPKWEGELGYYARLTRSIDVLPEDQIRPWLRTHKNGIVILRHRAEAPPYGTRIVYTQPYRSPGRIISIITNKK